MVINNYKISSKYKKRIVLISDVHYFNKNILKDLYELLDKIKELKPNFICITGDLVDDQNIKDEKDLILWLKKMSSICKVLISMGNHEYYYNHNPQNSYDKKLFNKIKKIKDVYVLDYKIYSEDEINFIGITLPIEYYDKEKEEMLINFMNDKYSKLSNGYNILLCHSPYMIARGQVLSKLNCRESINLILSGHMHGGLTFEFLKGILKGRGLINPKGGLFSNYCYGIYKFKNINTIISSGVIKLSKSHKLGVFNFLYKKEIVVIDI